MGTRRARQGAIRAINHRMARSWHGFEHPQGGGERWAADGRTRRVCWLCVCERERGARLADAGTRKAGTRQAGTRRGRPSQAVGRLVGDVGLASRARSESLRFKRALTIRVSSSIEAHSVLRFAVHARCARLVTPCLGTPCQGCGSWYRA